jgi:hypothetical protein
VYPETVHSDDATAAFQVNMTAEAPDARPDNPVGACGTEVQPELPCGPISFQSAGAAGGVQSI